MADQIFLHIGLPKTATTYLQTIVWNARDQLRDDGVLLPGVGPRDHLWTARAVCEHKVMETATPRQRAAWDRVRAEIAEADGRVLLTHEFLASATAEQARGMVEALQPAEVHLVLTARETLGLFTASWQESLKNRGTRPMADYPGSARRLAQPVWHWHTLDLREVLERWTDAVPTDRVHILPLPGPGAPRQLIWQRFAGLLGVDPSAYATDGFVNSSMGVAEAETLRRVNQHLVERDLLGHRHERGTMIRTYLADQRLVPRGGDRFWPTPPQIEECRTRADRAIGYVAEHGYHVLGDLEDLRVPDRLEERREAGSATAAEVAEIATDLVAQLLGDVYALRQERNAARRALEQALLVVPPPPPRWRALAGRVRGRLTRRSST